MSAPKCRSCAAPIRLEPGKTVYDCRFCGRSNVLESSGEISGAEHSEHVLAPQSSQKVPLLLIVAVAIVSLIGVIPALLLRGEHDSVLEDSTSRASNFSWGHHAAPVFAATDDGTLLIGIIRHDGDLLVAAFDALSFERVWQTSSLGSWGEHRPHTFVAAGDEHLAITHPDQTVTLHGLKDGGLVAQTALTDRAVGICSPPGTANVTWIALADERDVALDLTSASTRNEPLPDGCVDPRVFPNRCGHGPFHGASCNYGWDLPTHSGVLLYSGLILDDLGVAHGMRDPGTATPVLVGFDPADRSVRWTRRLDEIHPNVVAAGIKLADLVDERYYAEFRLGDRTRRLSSFDARTGELIFDTAIPRSDEGVGPETLRLHASRIYLPHWNRLHVFDADTGTHLKALGH